MKLTYNVTAKPPIGKTLLFALQQLLAILAATIAVPYIVNINTAISAAKGIGVASQMSQSAALFGAGVGTLVYLLFTKFKSPVFLGSSFAFLESLAAAFAGAATMATGYLGLLIGATLAGLVYVVIAIIVKLVGSGWVNKLMPPVVIGPTVAIIGLSLAGNAVGDLNGSGYAGLVCGLVTLAVTIACSVHGKKTVKMIPFIIGIAAGYILAILLTLIGGDKIQLVDFSKFELKNWQWYPDLTFIQAFFNGSFAYAEGNFGSFFLTVFVAYVPVAFVVFAEHIADHKNLSTIIEHDLLTDPGLDRTLLGDGVGSIAGSIFGGCPNTTYGESVGCVAISGNASIVTIFCTAVMAIVVSFIAPVSILLSAIPACVMGGVCIALYGFIAVSGLKMIQKVDLEDNRNLFVVSVILITGVGGLVVNFGAVSIRTVACALILGILTNVLCSFKKDKKTENKSENQ